MFDVRHPSDPWNADGASEAVEQGEIDPVLRDPRARGSYDDIAEMADPDTDVFAWEDDEDEDDGCDDELDVEDDFDDDYD